jgi:hypothetical protein
MIRQSAPAQVVMVAYSCVGVFRVTTRLPFARIAQWRPVGRVHLISPWRARRGDHAGHCIHHHRRQATDYLFAELASFKNPGSSGPPHDARFSPITLKLGPVRVVAVRPMVTDPANLRFSTTGHDHERGRDAAMPSGAMPPTP